MRQGIYTSGILHSFVGLLLITNFQLLENKPDEFLSNVSVKLLSEQELIKLSETKTTRALEVANFEPEVRVDRDRHPKKPDIPPKKNVGNEIKGASEPDVIKIKKRKTKDEIITDRAQRGDSEVAKPFMKEEKKIIEKGKLVKKFNNEKSKQKNTSSKILSEGENVKIVSGSLNTAKLPPSKPTIFEKGDQGDVNETLLQKDDGDIYGNLIEQVVKSQKKRKSGRNFNSESSES